MTQISQAVFDNLIACRDLMAFTITDQERPPDDLLAPMEQLVEKLFRRTEELRLENGFADPDITIYDPRLAPPA